MKRSLTSLLGMALLPISGQLAFAADRPIITFADIYASPDNEQLNLDYARQQAEAGELLDAAAALERMLFARPNWDSARLLYALVLYRVDDRDAAERELNLLDTRPLTASQRATLDRYRGTFRDDPVAEASAKLSGRLGLGVRYDDNAGNAVGDVVFGGAGKPDESLQFMSVTQIQAPVSADSDSALIIRGDVQLRRHEDNGRADYDVFALDAGFTGPIGNLTWTLQGEALRVNVNTQKYLNRRGGSARLQGALGDVTQWSAKVALYDEDFDNLNFTTNEPERSGGRLNAELGLSRQIGSRLNVNLTGLYERKSAKNDALAYDSLGARFRAKYAFNEASYIRGSVEYRDLDYEADSPFLFPFAPRADENLRVKMAVGTSVNGLLETLGGNGQDGLEKFGLEIGVNYIDRTTNIPTSGYENLGGEFRLTYDY